MSQESAKRRITVPESTTGLPGLWLSIHFRADYFGVGVTMREAPSLSGILLSGAILWGFPASAPSVTLQKAFTPTTIGPGGTTQLRFTVTNPAGSMSRSDLGIVDTLPAGLRIAPVPAVGGTCANAAAATFASSGGTSISVFNLQVPAGDSSCTVTVNITNAPGRYNANCSQQPADFTNSTNNVSVTNLTSAVTPSCLIVDRIFASRFE